MTTDRKPYPALCRDCKHSLPENESRPYFLRCVHPVVNANDAWALSSGAGHGSETRSERQRKWFAPCGMTGKLWEPKP